MWVRLPPRTPSSRCGGSPIGRGAWFRTMRLWVRPPPPVPLLYSEEFIMALGVEGYWISPRGSVFEVREHTLFMIEHPELFGLDGDIRVANVRAARSYRDELITDAIKKRWIRIRFASGSVSDMINAWRFDTKTFDNIMALYEDLEITFWETPISFSELSTGVRWTSTMREFAQTLIESHPVEMQRIIEQRKLFEKLT